MRCPICHLRLLPGIKCPSHHDIEVARDQTGPSEPIPKIDGFSALRYLGRGGFSTVYLARFDGGPQPRQVALKVASHRMDRRMAREAEILRRLGPPTTPSFIAGGVTGDDKPYIAMEYVGTDSLAHRMAMSTTLQGVGQGQLNRGRVEQAARELIALCRAVERLHAAGAIHRDLKPENILFRDSGDVVLIDLGLVRLPQRTGEASDVRLTHNAERMGTYHYMAPEQWVDDSAADERTDIYALGIIAFEMFTGRPPFVGEATVVRHGHVSGRCPRPSDLALYEIPAALDDILLRCLAKDRRRRFATANALGQALRDAFGPGEVRRRTPPRTGETPLDDPRGAERAMALLALPTVAEAPQVTALAHRHDAVVAAVKDGQYIMAFPWEQSPRAGVRAALDVARVAEHSLGFSGRCVVHVADVRMRRRKRALRLFGSDIAEPTRWTRSGSGTGLFLSDAAARAMEVNATEPAGAGFFTPVPTRGGTRLFQIDPGITELRGRDNTLRRLVREADTCARRAIPVLSTIEGDTGMGKTRLLHSLALALRRTPAYSVKYLSAKSSPDSPNDLVRQLLRIALDLPQPCSLSQLDASWHELGVEPPSAGHFATAYLLGLMPKNTPSLTPVLNTPGALRHAASRALALALARRAELGPLFLLIDDAHAADHIALDAVEMVTIGDKPAPLGVWVTATPELYPLRPRWGDRAASGQKYRLTPLDRKYAKIMFLDLLRPVEFVPKPVMSRLYALSGGVPLYIAELSRAIRDSGAIREHHHGTAGYYIAADELLRAANDPIDKRLASGALEAIPQHLVPLVQLCATLGDHFTEAEVRGVRNALGDTWIAGFDIDPVVGLSRLCARSLLRPIGVGYSVRHPLLRRAIEGLIPAPVRNRYHAAALLYWQESGHNRPDRLAYHAAHCGNSKLAARLYFELAESSKEQHRYTDAEQQYTLALEHLTVDGTLRQQALAGRGRVRYRLYRLRDALSDLRRARAIAEADDDAQVLLLLDEATVLDWCYQWKESAEVTEMALSRVARMDSDEIIAPLHLACGRVHYRREQIADAIDLLTSAVRRAAAVGDREIHIMAVVILAPALVYGEREDEAMRRFDEAIALCIEAGDDFHLAVAHLNRMLLWLKRQDLDRAITDLEIAMSIGRELGNAHFEHSATFNLAEIFYWLGSYDRALTLAHRARDLYLRFLLHYPDHHDHLLLARIMCCQGDREVTTCIEWIEEHCNVADLPPSAQALFALVHLAARAIESREVEGDSWLALENEIAGKTLHDERIEALLMAAELCCLFGHTGDGRDWLQRAKTASTGSRVWGRRITELDKRLG